MNFLSRACLIIDAIDEPILAQHRFYLAKAGYYVAHVYVNGKRTTKRIHQLIMGDAPDGMVVDHINRDKNDNRRANLRFVTVRQNGQNQGLRKNSLSGFRGVTLSRRGKTWYARCGGKYLGTYSTKEEAAAVAKAARCVSMPYSKD